MSGYSHRKINDQPLCLSSHSYSFSWSWRNESSHFTESAVKTSDLSGPLHTLIQEPLNTINPLQICLWAWTRLSLPLSHDICGLIYKCALAASADLLQTLAARKNNFPSAGTIHLWPSWVMEMRVLARSVLIVHWLTLAHIHVSQTKELHIHFWALPPRLLTN